MRRWPPMRRWLGRRASSRRARWLFLRGLGLTHFIAFSSLRRQVKGLYGERGIWPLKPVLAQLGEELGPSRFTELPSLLWFGASDASLVRLCQAGQLL